MKNREQWNSLTMDQISQKKNELEKKLFNIRFQKANGQMEAVGEIRKTKREIARAHFYSNQSKRENE